MNIWDILLLAVLAGIVILAVRAAVKRARSPGCACCGGQCPGCAAPGNQRERKAEDASENGPPRGGG